MNVTDEFALKALERQVIDLIDTESHQVQQFIMHYVHQGLADVLGDLVAAPAVIYCKADSFKIYLSVVYIWGGIKQRWTNSFSKKDMQANKLPELVQVAVANIKADAKRTLELSGRSQKQEGE